MNKDINLFMPVRALLRGVGQVMFQCSAWTGLLFLAGIFWGSYYNHVPQVAWGCLAGVTASTIAGLALGEKTADGRAGLWGFNGALVGCAFPTFLPNTWLMWVCLVFFAMMSTWVRRGFNNAMAAWGINSLTFPFVFLTWIMLFAVHMSPVLPGTGLSQSGLPEAAGPFVLDTEFGQLVVYWLKGISQVFLINSWVTGICFVVGLALCSPWAAMWAVIASAVSLALACLFHVSPHDIANGLFGFSPVLTGIALGMTFYKPGIRTALWTLLAIVATFFVQAAMDVLLEPWGLPTLTGPFCLATWLFWLPAYKLNPQPKQ